MIIKGPFGNHYFVSFNLFDLFVSSFICLTPFQIIACSCCAVFAKIPLYDYFNMSDYYLLFGNDLFIRLFETVCLYTYATHNYPPVRKF